MNWFYNESVLVGQINFIYKFEEWSMEKVIYRSARGNARAQKPLLCFVLIWSVCQLTRF